MMPEPEEDWSILFVGLIFMVVVYGTAIVSVLR